LRDGDWISLTVDGISITLPTIAVPGQADRVIALTVGQGRTLCGSVGEKVGWDTYPLMAKNERFGAVSITRLERNSEVCRTQEHFNMEQRPIAREGTLAMFRTDPEFAKKMVEKPDENVQLWPSYKYEGHKWGMTIDLNQCIGCNACMMACQSENNIAIVGIEQVKKSREMSWIRVDRYFEGDVDGEPRSVITQPMLCQQCENAPCEQVCPVGATSHSAEGLNDMAYNRCIGTRYCANNCPFKVRRFNFFNYTLRLTQATKMQLNPDVSVRERGVMEKCTWCVQRINRAKVASKIEGENRVHDGSIITACQQACPTKAIVFGDLNDPNSQVAKLHQSARSYLLLEELNVRPRLAYLAKIRNPNPELAS
jgi:molybdopterin-containing oxidoreductase family iron-sulfur binding subunit